jgi:hypothetical protein
MHTCRFCRKYEGKMVKYAARHWAHFECWLLMKGRELEDPTKYEGILDLFVASFHDWQLKQFPVFKLAEWLEQRKTQFPDRSGTDWDRDTWVDKAAWLITKAIERTTVIA